MAYFKCCICALLISFSCGYSQIILSGRFVQPNETTFDSKVVVIKEPTGDTSYARASALRDGSFHLETGNSGMLMAEFRRPHFRTLRVALLSDRPEQINVDVTLSDKSDPHNNSKIVFHDSSSLLAKFALLQFRGNSRLNRPAVNLADWKDVTRTIEEALAMENEPILRQELILQHIEANWTGSPTAQEDSIEKKSILEIIPPTSPVWVYHFNLAYILSISNRQEPFKYLNEIFAHHSNLYFVKYLYINPEFRFKGDASAQWNWSSGDRPTMSAVRVGEPVPQFALRSMDDSSKTFSGRTMMGQVYLIDFWTTWCGACVTQIPYLSKAFERFKTHGFTILSVSDDDSTSTVLRYRNHEWAMPWQNALGSSQPNGSIRWSFGAVSIPFPVLVSAQGTILALGDDLKDENLEHTLEKFITN